MFYKTLGIFVFTLLLQCLSQAKSFSNPYISFEIPDRWNCTLEHTEWVCRADDPKDKREAIIILTAKEVGPTDSFGAYEQHLNTPQAMQGKKTSGITSAIRAKAKTYPISNQNWIDGFHESSEVENYLTRYLATIKEQVAILVTFSAHKTVYAKYSADFEKAIRSLSAKSVKNIYGTGVAGGSLRPAEGQIFGQHIKDAMTGLDEDLQAGDPNANAGESRKSLLLLIVAAVLVGAGVFLFLKKK